MANPMRISARVDIDASGARSGAAEANTAVASIGTTAEAAAAKLDNLQKTASEGIRSPLSVVGGTAATGTADAAAAALNRLRAKCDPLVAAQLRFRQRVEEINAAQAAGALTISRAIELRQQEKVSYDALISSINNVAAARKAATEAAVARVTITPDRGADIAAYGVELDKLRAKYNPLYAVIVQYKAAQAEVRQAHAVGAISADEMTAALQRQRQAALASIDAIKGRNSALSQAPSAANQNFQTANLAFQVQDVVTTGAFMPWYTVALQQGPQVAAIMDTLDNKAAGLKAAFLGLISPWSLISVAAVGATAFAIQYFTKAENGTRSVDDILERHAANIAALGPAYKKALEEQQRYVNASPALAAANASDTVAAARKKAEEAAEALRVAAYRELPTGPESVGEIFNAAVFNEFKRFDLTSTYRALQEFNASIEAGTPKVTEFLNTLAKLEATGEVSAESGRKLREFAKDAIDTEKALSGIRGDQAADTLAAPFARLQDAIDKVNPSNLSGRLGELDGKLADLYKSMRAGEIDSDSLKRSIVTLASANPDMSAAIEEIGRVGQAALEAQAKVAALGRAVNTTQKTGRVSTPDARAAAINFETRWGDEDNGLAAKLEEQAEKLKRANEKSARSGESARKAYEDLVKSADDRIAQMKLEAETAGETGVAADTLRFQLDLLQKSEEKGRSLSPKQVEAINARVESFKKYAEEAAKARLSADLLFEREQLGRSTFDQQIASTLRSAGLSVDFDSYEAGLIRTNLQLQYMRDLAGEATSTFFSGIEQGKSVLESLGDAGVSALKRIADTMLNDVLNSIFAVKSAGSGSSGGLFGTILSGIGSVLGFGGSSATSSTSWSSSGDFDISSPSPGFAGGGYTGDGGKHEVAGDVHRREIVWSEEDIARNGGVAKVEAMRRGYGDAGATTASVTPLYSARTAAVMETAARDTGAPAARGPININVNVEGARGNAEIREMVAEGVREGLTGYDANLPDRLDEIEQNDRWR